MVIAFVLGFLSTIGILAVVWRPSIAIATTICVYSFEQWAQANSSFFGQHGTFLNFFVGLINVAALASVIIRGHKPWNTIPLVTWVVMALYMLAGISCYWAPSAANSLSIFLDSLPYIITIAFMSPLLITDSKDAKIALAATCVIGGIVLVLLLFGTRVHAWGRTIEFDSGVVSARTGKLMSRGNPLAIAATAGHVIIIATLLRLTGAVRIVSWLKWAIVGVGIILIYKSGSRGQLIALFAALGIFVGIRYQLSRFRGILAVTVASAVVVILSSIFYLNFADQERWSLEEMTTNFQSTRVEMCSEVLDEWLSAAPIFFLIGLGSSASFDIIGNYPHVVPIEVLCELGFIGLFLLLSFYALVIRSVFRLWIALKNLPTERGTLAVLGALFVYEFLLTLKQGNLLHNSYIYMFAIAVCRYDLLVVHELKKQSVDWLRQGVSQQDQLHFGSVPT